MTPEERRRIYEEERARIEAENKRNEQESTTGLRPGTAGLLCYLGFWITGIIFLVIEQKDRTVRFHAAQSSIVFGALNILYALVSQVPIAGILFGTVVGVLAFVLWLVLMIKATQGVFVLPVAGDIAARIIGLSGPPEPSPGVPRPPAPSAPVREEPRVRASPRFESGRAARIASSAFAIAIAVALLVFLNFYNEYIAYYYMRGGLWFREPILTGNFSSWLPVVNTALTLSIAGHALLLAFDKYLLRESVLLVLDIFSIVSIATLLSIFPFDFSPFGASLVGPIDFSVRLSLVLIIFGMGIAVLVRLIKILVNVLRGTAGY